MFTVSLSSKSKNKNKQKNPLHWAEKLDFEQSISLDILVEKKVENDLYTLVYSKYSHFWDRGFKYYWTYVLMPLNVKSNGVPEFLTNV